MKITLPSNKQISDKSTGQEYIKFLDKMVDNVDIERVPSPLNARRGTGAMVF